jgi:hypothetical protein
MWVIPDFGIWVIFSKEKIFGGGAKIRMSFGVEFCLDGCFAETSKQSNFTLKNWPQISSKNQAIYSLILPH